MKPVTGRIAVPWKTVNGIHYGRLAKEEVVSLDDLKKSLVLSKNPKSKRLPSKLADARK